MSRLLFALGLFLCCTGCGEEAQPNGMRSTSHEAKRLQQPDSIAGLWQLHLVDDTVFNMTVVYGFPAAQPTLELRPADNKIGGFSGCNHFGGTVSVKDGKFDVPEPFEATEVGCGMNVWENEYFDRLQHTIAYERSGDNLTLFSRDGQSMLFTRKVIHPLEKGAWLLAKVNKVDFDMQETYGDDPQPLIRFHFGKGTMGGWNGCNHFGLQIDFKDTYYTSGTLHSDARGCYPGWLETFYGTVGGHTSVYLKNDTLLLANQKGESMQFVRQVE